MLVERRSAVDVVSAALAPDDAFVSLGHPLTEIVFAFALSAFGRVRLSTPNSL